MKKVGVGLLLLLLLLLLVVMAAVWYLGIKKEDYQITFRVKGTVQGTYHHILKWNKWGENGVGKAINTDSTLFSEVQKKVLLQDTILQLNWNVDAVNDSITEVVVAAHSGEQSIANRLAILTGETLFTKSLKKELKEFRSVINSFGETYRIHIDGIVTTPSLRYLYVTDVTERNQKALKMITANADVYPKISEYRVEKDGFPFIKVTSWEMANDRITFDFGFPIREFSSSSGVLDSLPLGERIDYGELSSFKALKATFYGNYAKSDQAWFALLNYAEENDIKVKNEPLEIFYHNPMSGGDDRKWKAEVFMPIIE